VCVCGHQTVTEEEPQTDLIHSAALRAVQPNAPTHEQPGQEGCVMPQISRPHGG